MALHLTIENEASLPDGGPLSIAVTGRRGIDIGRDQYLDWTLPDPTRTISGKHCEIRHHDGAFWLRDVSRNGTFLNRNPQRVQEPYRLRDGDRIEIGRYIIAVRIEGEEAAPAGMVSAPVAPAEYWNTASEAAPAISPRELRPPRELKPVRADFSEWAIDVPAATGPQTEARPPPAELGDMSWAQRSPPPAPALPPPMPAPRRPLPSAPGADAWGEAPHVPGPPASGPWDEGAPGAAWDMPPLPAAAPVVGPTPTWDGPPPQPAPSAISAPAFRPAPPAGPPDGGMLQPATTPTVTTSTGDAAEVIRRFARGAGIPAETLAWRDPGDLAEEVGALVRMSAESLKQMLAARAETKRVARSGNQTTIQALDNNPLKFSPTIEDALRIMFGRPSSGYLDARRALEQGFKDLKTHQVKTYAAMQNALRLLLAELDPEVIAGSGEADRGLGGMLGSKKARLWDIYATRWDALSSPYEEGMVDAFMIFFAECYDRGSKT